MIKNNTFKISDEGILTLAWDFNSSNYVDTIITGVQEYVDNVNQITWFSELAIDYVEGEGFSVYGKLRELDDYQQGELDAHRWKDYLVEADTGVMNTLIDNVARKYQPDYFYIDEWS